jgi:hypothetical protein
MSQATTEKRNRRTRRPGGSDDCIVVGGKVDVGDVVQPSRSQDERLIPGQDVRKKLWGEGETYAGQALQRGLKSLTVTHERTEDRVCGGRHLQRVCMHRRDARAHRWQAQ